MLLNVRELGGVLESRYVPVEMSQPLVQVRVSRTDISDIGLCLWSVSLSCTNLSVTAYLEVLHINNVKSHNRCEEPDICLRDVLAIVIWTTLLLRQMLLCSIQALE